jgi:hypothetical protein
MNHEQVQALLSDYLEGTLEAGQAKEIDEHLEACADCKGELTLLRRALALVHELPPVEAPPHFGARLKRKARKAGLFDARKRRGIPRHLVPFEAIMVVLLAAMGALVIFMLMFYSKLQELEVETKPVAILVQTNPELNFLAQCAWQVDGQVHALNRVVPPDSPLGATPELELVLDAGSWPAFLKCLGPQAKAALPDDPPEKGRDGRLHVIVQIRMKRG